MTFEEWFEQIFVPEFTPKGKGLVYGDDYPYKYERIARKAWEASRENLRSWDI